VVSVNSDDAAEASHLNQEAAKSIRYGGLTHDEALKLVTLNPAIQLGIEKRVGSIDVGKDADLAIYNHDPMSDYAVVQKTLIDGRVYFDREKDILGRPALQQERKDLLAKAKKEREKKDSEKKEGGAPKPGAEKKPEEEPKPPQVDGAEGGAR
jgi:adenine deaminase